MSTACCPVVEDTERSQNRQVACRVEPTSEQGQGAPPHLPSKFGRGVTGGFGVSPRVLCSVTSSNKSDGTTNVTGAVDSSSPPSAKPPVKTASELPADGRRLVVRIFCSFDAATISLNAAAFKPENCVPRMSSSWPSANTFQASTGCCAFHVAQLSSHL